MKNDKALLKDAARALKEQYTEDEVNAIIADYAKAYDYAEDDCGPEYILEEVLADYYAGIDIWVGSEDAQADLRQRRETVRQTVGSRGERRTEADQSGPERTSRDYLEAIEKLDRGELRRDEDTHIQVLDHTPQIYIDKAGAKDRRIMISWESAYLAMKRSGDILGNYHGLGVNLMKELPEKIKNPEYIVSRSEKRINAVLEMRKNNRPIIVSVEMEAFEHTTQEGMPDNGKFNLIVTVTDVRSNYLKNTILKPEKILYSKNNEDPAHFISRLNLPPNADMSGNDHARSYENDDSTGGENVKGKFSMDTPVEEARSIRFSERSSRKTEWSRSS